MKGSRLLTLSEFPAFLEKLEFLENPEKTFEDIARVQEVYPSRITHYLADRIISLQSKPLFGQFIPQIEELYDTDGIGAFFSDEKHLERTLVQKYPNRCIVYLTSECFANCRYCSRKELWKKRDCFSKRLFDEDLRTLTRLGFEEVILTGGDAFAIGIDNLDYVLDSISQIDSVKVIRIATRAFTVNPEIVDMDICDVLSGYPSIIVMTQLNHSDEFSEKTREALKRIQKTGSPILNQSVLLKGINDSTQAMRDLLTSCACNRVIPYYLFHAFKVKGAQCYRTDPKVGLQIIDDLIGNIGGWWIPKYTLIPSQTGVKIPLQPNGIVREERDNLVLKDFRNRELIYE